MPPGAGHPNVERTGANEGHDTNNDGDAESKSPASSVRPHFLSLLARFLLRFFDLSPRLADYEELFRGFVGSAESPLCIEEERVAGTNPHVLERGICTLARSPKSSEGSPKLLTEWNVGRKFDLDELGPAVFPFPSDIHPLGNQSRRHENHVRETDDRAENPDPSQFEEAESGEAM